VSHTAAPPKLSARVVRPVKLDEDTRAQMYRLFASVYLDTDPSRFARDLHAKDHVIVLRVPGTSAVGGFSTLRSVAVRHEGRVFRAVFSGDTVIDRPYWGQKVLGRAFLRYLLIRRLRHPTDPLYWILISKGYKTYLLMANNFPVHWPRHEAATPAATAHIRDAFATALFGDDYDPAAGLVRFPPPRDRLRPDIAPVHDALTRRSPRVAHFLAQNPGWADGDELVCLAELSWSLPATYTLKAWRRP